MPKVLKLWIFRYPDAMSSAIFGSQEMLQIAQDLVIKMGLGRQIEAQVFSGTKLPNLGKDHPEKKQIVFFPPSITGDFYLTEHPQLSKWILHNFQSGHSMISACAGVFFLAYAGIIGKLNVTTHWGLQDKFSQLFPDLNVDSRQLIIDHNKIITAGGMMSWTDLMMHIIRKQLGDILYHELCSLLIIEERKNNQMVYSRFHPILDHGVLEISKIQSYLTQNFRGEISIEGLAKRAKMSYRTFLRKFHAATNYSPIEYLQQLRIDHSTQLLKQSYMSIEEISCQCGYHDQSAFRKIFVKIKGISPNQYRKKY